MICDLCIGMDIFDFTDKHFMRSRNNRLYYCAFNIYRAIRQEGGIYLFAVLQLNIHCGQLVPVPFAVASQIIKGFLITPVHKIYNEAAGFLIIL